MADIAGGWERGAIAMPNLNAAKASDSVTAGSERLVMYPRSHVRDPFGYGRRRGTFSAWAMAIAFATVAAVSFAIDQTISLSPDPDEQSTLSVLHPVELIQSLIESAAE
jgi:hypothetical protein